MSRGESARNPSRTPEAEPEQPADDREPVLPDRPSDETDIGWGDAEPFADDDLRRLTDDVPPHHLDRD